MLNVLDVRSKVEIVFHGLNPDDPAAKIEAFKEIVAGASTRSELHYELGEGGRVPSSSSSFRWVTISVVS